MEITAEKLSVKPRSSIYIGLYAKRTVAKNPIMFQICGGRSSTGASAYNIAMNDALITLGFPPVNAA